ncbi:MAG: fasciclin domain-containing protein [Fimbriimonadaceae bacterium]|nr:fasciclin domain-containing protein [Fimbriimonadaceae bacterium]
MLNSLLLAGALAAPQGMNPSFRPSDRNLLKTIEHLKLTPTFLEVLKKSKWSRTLRSAGPYTVFAPQESFFRSSPRLLDRLNDDAAFRDAWVGAHIAPVSTRLFELTDGQTSRIKSMGPSFLTVQRDGNRIFIGPSIWILRMDLLAANGTFNVANGAAVDEATASRNQAR